MTIEAGDKIVPRWEWRTFSATLGAIDEKLAPLADVAPHPSAEIYFLRRGGQQNAKIRDDIFYVKHLRGVDADGLELWEPVFTAKFPLGRGPAANSRYPVGLKRGPGLADGQQNYGHVGVVHA